MRRRRNENPLSLFSFQDIITSVTGILILLAIMLAIAVIRQTDAAPVDDIRPEIDALSAQVKSLETEISQLDMIVRETDSQMTRWSGRTKDELQTELASLLATKKMEEAKLYQFKSSVADARQNLQKMATDPLVGKLKSAIAEGERKLTDINNKKSQLSSGKRVVYHFRNTSSRPWLVEITKERIRAGRAGEKATPLEFKTVNQFIAFVKAQPEGDRYFVLILKPSGVDVYGRIRDELNSLNVDIGTDLLDEGQTALDSQTGAVIQ